MRIAHNPQTGEYIGLQNGEWKPLRIAANAAGEKLYLGDNGWEPLPGEGVETPDSPRASLGEQAAKGAAFGARNLLEGAGGVVDTFLNQPVNAVGRLFGYDPGLKNPGTVLSDAMGLPVAQTDSDRRLAALQKGMAETVPTVAAGAAPAVAKAAPRLAGFLAESPALQAASGGAAGLASEEARQNGAGTGGQVAAGLIGAFAPGAASSLGTVGIRGLKSSARALEALSPGGQRRIAAENIRGYAKDGDGLLAQLEAGGEELVPGSRPTLAQAVNDPGLAVAEKGRASRGPAGALFQERYLAQRDARNNELEELASGIENRRAGQASGVQAELGSLKPFGEFDSPVAYNGGTLRNIYDSRYQAAKGRTREAYAGIDPDGTASFSLSPLRDAFQAVLPQGPFAPRLPADISRIMGKMDEAIKEGVPASYRDLQDIRTTLTDLAESARVNGDANLRRIASGLKNELDTYIDSAAYLDVSPVRPQPGSRAYAVAGREAEKLAGADPWHDDLKYMYEQGINRDWLVSQFGEDSAAQLNKMYPGLVRRNGQFIPDVSSADLGTATVRNDGAGLYEMLLDRLPYRQSARDRRASAMNQLLEANAVQPTGFSLQQRRAFQRAKELRREQGGLFEQGFNEKMSRGLLRDDQVMGNYFKSGSAGDGAAKDFLRAFGNDETAWKTMQDYIVSQFRQASTTKDVLSAQRMEKWLAAHKDALSNFPELKVQLEGILLRQKNLEASAGAQRQLFKRTTNGTAKLTGMPVEKVAGAAALDPVEITRFRALQEDLARNRRMTEAAGVKGSPTAQNLATQAVMDTLLGRSLGRNTNGPGGNGGALNILKNMGIGVTNRLAGMVYGKADDAINQLIDQAFLDPAFARELLKTSRSYIPKEALGKILKRNARAGSRQYPVALGGLLGEFEKE